MYCPHLCYQIEKLCLRGCSSMQIVDLHLYFYSPRPLSMALVTSECMLYTQSQPSLEFKNQTKSNCKRLQIQLEDQS